jgi:predicted acylesterase/phospholipase RssA
MYICSCHAYKVIRFPGGGIFFWWQAGAAAYLSKNCPTGDIPVVGASAGAIAASMLVLNCSFDQGAKLAVDLADSRKVWEAKRGLVGIWGPIVKEFLEVLIPEQPSVDDLARINIIVTPKLIVKGPIMLSQFPSKADLIDAIMASIHIPMVMDGRTWATYRDKHYIDGSFWSWVAGVDGPWPVSDLSRERDVLLVDYKRDERFRKAFPDTSLVQLIKPAELQVMMAYGYSYMEKLDTVGQLSARLAQSGKGLYHN